MITRRRAIEIISEKGCRNLAGEIICGNCPYLYGLPHGGADSVNPLRTGCELADRYGTMDVRRIGELEMAHLALEEALGVPDGD